MANPPPHQARKLKPWVQKCVNWAGRFGHPIVLSTLATSAIVLVVRTVGGVQGLELGVYDQMMRLRSPLSPDDRILVVGIDETDIQSRGEWPIKDSTLVELLDILLAANPRAIGLDIFRDVPIGEDHEQLLAQLKNNQQVFSVCRMNSADNPGVPPPSDVAFEQVGFADLVVDPGGILRRSLLFAQPPNISTATAEHVCNDPNSQLSSLSFQIALSYLAEEGIDPEITQDQQFKLKDTVLPRLASNIGGYTHVDAGGYQLLLNFRAGRDAVSQVSLVNVLSGDVAPEQIRDRVVLIGTTASEAKDEFYTPYSGGLQDSQKMPGVVVHAQAVSQILSAVLDGRPFLWSWSTLGEGVWIVSWGLGGSLFAWFVRRPIRFTLGTIVLLSSLYGTCYLLFLYGGWIPLVPPAVALALAAGGVVLIDRFNKSDYGKAVYKQMKSLLRLDIAIDSSKVGQQVAEITETEYFASLQKQARQLRQNRQTSSTTSETGIPKKKNCPQPKPDTPTNMEDYFDDLKREARRLKSSDNDKAD